MIKYLNTKIYGKTETIDQLDSKDFINIIEYKKARMHLLNEYRIAGYGSPYWSSRKCK